MNQDQWANYQVKSRTIFELNQFNASRKIEISVVLELKEQGVVRKIGDMKVGREKIGKLKQ